MKLIIYDNESFMYNVKTLFQILLSVFISLKKSLANVDFEYALHFVLKSIYSLWAYGVVVSMFDFHRSDQGSNPGRGGNIS